MLVLTYELNKASLKLIILIKFMSANTLKKCLPCVSVIIACRNAEKWISLAIQSVLKQSFQSFEIIVADDCSTDSSLILIKSFIEKDDRINLISLKKQSGAGAARNAALNIATGRYISFLDADDIWLENKLEVQITFMKQGNHALCFAAYEKINDNGMLIGKVGVPQRVNYRTLLKTCVMGCLTVVYDSQYFGKVEMPLLKKRQDYALWLKLLKKVEFAYGINIPLAQYRIHNNTLSSNKLMAAIYTWKLFHHTEKLPFLPCIYYFSHYSIRGVLRQYFPRLALTLGALQHVE